MTGTPTFDLGPQARIVARLAAAVPDARLVGWTPCPVYTVAGLLGHLVGLAAAFRDAARKDLGVTTDTAPGTAVPVLSVGWREELPVVLGELAPGLAGAGPLAPAGAGPAVWWGCVVGWCGW
ncbi:maleylpyruvate isomerase N-terminal domain-containing protein [Streptomyces xanthophaeus]|uniref:maleylpyruvate isomerase N-terminal domain-containing protein n=1 Tax=Streptomyces xanthophaeus TaxID=67385 RepID=UPI003F595BD5|nr:maleylpyruvate isomerase N-terminal domain-containing protein [Streptomyces xanthophaeus]